MAKISSKTKQEAPKVNEELPESGAPVSTPEEGAAPSGLRGAAKTDAPAEQAAEVDPIKAEAKKLADSVKNTALAALVGEKTPENIVKNLTSGIGTTVAIARGVNNNEAISNNLGLQTANLVGSALATAAIQNYDYLNYKNAPLADEVAAAKDSLTKTIATFEKKANYADHKEFNDSEVAAMKLMLTAVEGTGKDAKFAASDAKGVRAIRAILDTRFAAIKMVQAERNFEVPTFKQTVKTLTGFDADKLTVPGKILNGARTAFTTPEVPQKDGKTDFDGVREAVAKAALGLGEAQQKGDGILPQVIFAVPVKTTNEAGEKEQVSFRKLLSEAGKGYNAYKAEKAAESDAKFAEKNSAEKTAEMGKLTDLIASKGGLLDAEKTAKKIGEKGVWIVDGGGHNKKFQPKEENQKAFVENLMGLAQGEAKAVEFFEANWMSRKAAIVILEGLNEKVAAE